MTYRILQRAPVPEEALRLTEDVRDMQEAIKLLWKVDPRNVSDEPEKDKFWFLIQKLKEFERHARRKLAVEFLDPRKKIVKKNERKAAPAFK